MEARVPEPHGLVRCLVGRRPVDGRDPFGRERVHPHHRERLSQHAANVEIGLGAAKLFFGKFRAPERISRRHRDERTNE